MIITLRYGLHHFQTNEIEIAANEINPQSTVNSIQLLFEDRPKTYESYMHINEIYCYKWSFLFLYLRYLSSIFTSSMTHGEIYFNIYP